MFVQATIACNPDDIAVAQLRRRSRRPIFKWSDVNEFVLSQTSDDARVVRNRLEEATITIVDPAVFLRALDLSSRRPSVPLLSRQFRRDPQFNAMRRVITRRVGRVLLIHSGAESVYSLLRSPLVGEGLLAHERMEGLRGIKQLDPLSVAERTPDLNKLARIALQTTALVAHEYDPDARGDIEVHVEEMRWGMDDRRYNQARLEALARRSIVYDRGHEDATSIAARLHRAACDRLADSPLSWASPDDPDDLAGEVRTGVTAVEVQLQMADVAAGWAAHLLSTHGALALSKTFRIVLHNGLQLTNEEAQKLDTERRFHDSLIDRSGR